MAVDIKLKGGDIESDEYKASLVLKQIFEHDLPNNINGEVLIYSNATLFGQEPKDVDIVVVGKLEKYKLELLAKSEYKNDKGEKITDDESLKEIYINDFCFVIELKSHRVEDISRNGIDLCVQYNSKIHSVTAQSEKQKYSLMNYFKDRLGFSPYICNFIWLTNVSNESIQNLITSPGQGNKLKNNYLPTRFSLKKLFEMSCIQKPPWFGNYYGFSSFFKDNPFNINQINSIFEVFNASKRGIGQMTRRKIERITRLTIRDQDWAKAIGNKLLIMAGRAGTGKTIKLLNIACNLATEKGARCLILTFNNALVGDIKRMIALAEIPDGTDEYSVGIKTLDSFFYQVLKGFHIGVPKEGDTDHVENFIGNREIYLNKLYEYIKQGAIDDGDIQELMKNNHDAVAWDYVLIDEAQDWSELEKELIFRIFGYKNIIVADGVDQLIRSQKKCNWSKELKVDVDFIQKTERRGLRQEFNVVNFVNLFAREINTNWEVEPKEDLIGGKVIVSLKPYSKAFHDKLFQIVQNAGNKAYEMLFLVPPNLINRNNESNGFIYKDVFEKDGIKIWDGTIQNLRSEYAVDTDQHRLLQYDSCRGLEGWCVACLNFDDFVKYKSETFKQEDKDGQLGFNNFIEDRKRFVNLWSLIPLTRAIDTLVITIRDKESPVCKNLRNIYEKHPDYIEWIE